MTKIFGFTYRGTADPVSKQLSRRMGERLVRKKWQRYDIFGDNQAILGTVALSKKDIGLSVQNDSGSLRMIYNGYFIFPAESGNGTSSSGYEWQAKMGRAFLEDYGRLGPSAARKLNGVFSMAIQDREKEEISLLTDRLGLGLLYYHISGGKLIFASEVKAIIEDKTFQRKVNWKGWSDVFNLNWVAGNDTLFEDIFSLAPGTVLKFNYGTGVYSLNAYWTEDEIRIDQDMTEETAYHGSIEQMRQAVRKFSGLRKEHILALSGGNDSRFIALALNKEGIGFRAISTNKDNYDTLDLVNSEKLSRLLGINRTVVELKKDMYPRYFLDFLEDTDYLAPEHLWLSPLVHAFPVDALVYDGFAGGIILGENFHPVYRKETKNFLKSDLDESIFLSLQKKYFREPYERIFRPIFHEKIRDLSPVHFKNSDRPFCDNYLLFSKLYNRSRRGIGAHSFTSLNNYSLPVLPFAENDFFNFSLSIPIRFRLNYYIFNRIISEMEPGLEAIPTSWMGVDVKDSPRQARIIDHRKTLRLVHGLLKKYRLPDEFVHRDVLDKWLKDLQVGKRNPFLRARQYLYFSLWYNKYFK